MKKSAGKSNLKPFNKGTDKRRGRGPKKGAPNAGRPPDQWKEECRKLVSRNEMLDRARAVLDNPEHPAWLGALKFLTEQGYGRAAQTLDLTSDNTLTVVFK